MELLRSLEWKRFEELVAMVFEVTGFATELTRVGADGGVDISVFKPGDAKPTAVVQCKAWNKYVVGVKPVRELFGVMAAEGVGKGYFAATGKYTEEARAFVEGKPIRLLTGEDIVERIGKLPGDKRRRLYERAVEGDYMTPSCPKCGRKLVRRVSRKGRSEGGEFWGCPGFPKCRYTMRISGGEE